MKLKRLIKFYFNAEKLNNWLDGMTVFRACTAHAGRAASDFDRVLEIVCDKIALERLYSYLKVIMDGLTEKDRSVLYGYSLLRMDIKRLRLEEYREYKRAVMKFSRKLIYSKVYLKEFKVLGKYAALI